jgi:ABC-type nitrate/sulfonate/bicarbonate transport system permease component
MSTQLSVRAPSAMRPPRFAWSALGTLKRFGSILALLLVWEIAGRLQLVRPFLLPHLESVILRFYTDIVTGAFFWNAALTLYRAMVGFALAAVIGVPLGILIGVNRLMRWFWDPLVSLGFPMPKIAFLPVFMLWFGVFDLSKIAMVAFSSVFVVIASTQAGTAGVERWVIWSARSMGAGRIAVFFQVMLPAAMPQILTGLQVAMPVALITTVVAEMLMGGAGLGGMMMQAGSYADSVGVFVGIIETSCVGAIAVTAMAQLRRRLLRWHPEFNPR